MKEIKDNRKIFDIIASKYIREDSHWGADLDLMKITINKLLEKHKEIKVMDATCGPGFHIAALAEFYPEIEIVGLDYSPPMVKLAQARIHKLGLKNVKVDNADFVNFKHNQKFHLIICLNNSLGNIFRAGIKPENLRFKVIKKMYKMLSSNGYLILSVFNRSALDSSYGQHLTIRGDLSNLTKGDLFVEYQRGQDKTLYYSHWFTKSEIAKLDEVANFKLDFLEKRLARFLVCLQKHA